ncbi:MAG: helix-turn-helix domain-containing protein [Ginsengibacter sp.]
MKYSRNNKIIKQFGEKVRQVRLAKGLSQETLALESGLEDSQINRIELSKINTSISHLFILQMPLKLTRPYCLSLIQNRYST